MRRIRRAIAIALLALAGLYAGDYLSARYGIPGHRQTLGSVQVQTLYAVRQKGNRIEYMLGDSVTQTCVRSLFPQMGYTPCWYLSGHATKRIDISRAAPGDLNSHRFSRARIRFWRTLAILGHACPGKCGGFVENKSVIGCGLDMHVQKPLPSGRIRAGFACAKPSRSPV